LIGGVNPRYLRLEPLPDATAFSAAFDKRISEIVRENVFRKRKN
jgi:hypothetical protein